MKKNNFVGKVFISKCFEETQKLGRDFGRVLEKGDRVALYGDLGSGKTTFVQGLAEGLGIKEKIISPTFIIVRCYELQIQNYNSKFKNLEPITFFHIDLYRISGEKDIKELGLEEILNDSSNIIVIEWAENLKGLMPAKRIDIEFFYEKDSTRKITFRPRR